MGLGDYFSAKAENAMMFGAAGFASTNPHAALQIGATLDMEFAGLTPEEGYRAQDDILDALRKLVRIAEMSERMATEDKHKLMRAADEHRRSGDKVGMYAASMAAAPYRRAIAAAKGKPKDVAQFEEMAIAVANAIAVYRLAESEGTEVPL